MICGTMTFMCYIRPICVQDRPRGALIKSKLTERGPGRARLASQYSLE